VEGEKEEGMMVWGEVHVNACVSTKEIVNASQ